MKGGVFDPKVGREEQNLKPVATEQLYVLRLWQEEGETIWRASLKPMNNNDEAAQYFHTLESFVRFIKTTVQETKGEK
jgi:hypothetical protein